MYGGTAEGDMAGLLYKRSFRLVSSVLHINYTVPAISANFQEDSKMKRTSNRNAAIEYLKRECLIYEYHKEDDSLCFLKPITKDLEVSLLYKINITDDGYCVSAYPNISNKLRAGHLKFEFPYTPQQINIISELTRLILYINSTAGDNIINFSPMHGFICCKIKINGIDTPEQAGKSLSTAVETEMAALGFFSEDMADILYNEREACCIFPELRPRN